MANLFKRRVVPSPLCPFCGEVEIIEHVLLCCEQATQVWFSVLGQHVEQKQITSLVEWWELTGSMEAMVLSDRNESLMKMAEVVWLIQKSRGNMAFNKTLACVSLVVRGAFRHFSERGEVRTKGDCLGISCVAVDKKVEVEFCIRLQVKDDILKSTVIKVEGKVVCDNCTLTLMQLFESSKAKKDNKGVLYRDPLRQAPLLNQSNIGGLTYKATANFQESCVILNIDGSWVRPTEWDRATILARNFKGNILKGRAKHIIALSLDIMEVEALFMALELMKDMGQTNTFILIKCLTLVHAF